MSLSMLRARLTWITENCVFPDSQAREVERLRKITGHTIRVLNSSADDLAYNCVSHALGLAKDPEYLCLASKCANTHADTAFVQHLINGKAIVEQPTWKAGLLGVYADGTTITHIGRFISDSHLTSKWGPGLLWEHGAFEVPDSYGDTLRAFSAPDPSAVRQHFVCYARCNGEVI